MSTPFLPGIHFHGLRRGQPAQPREGEPPERVCNGAKGRAVETNHQISHREIGA